MNCGSSRLVAYFVSFVMSTGVAVHCETCAQNGIVTDQTREHAANIRCSADSASRLRSLNGKMMAEFKGRQVRDYVAAINSRRPTFSAPVVPPSQFVAVVESGKSAVPFLLSCLSSEDESIAVAASMALGEITDKTFARYPEDFHPHRNLDRWNQVISDYKSWWKAHKKQSQLEWLVESLEASSVPIEQETAMTRIGQLHDRAGIKPLRRMLSSKTLRPGAALALAELGDRDVIPILINELLTDQYSSTRAQGICALEKLTGQSMDFNALADAASRDVAVENWRKWWTANGGTGASRVHH